MAEGGGLLNRYTLSRRIEGSNPSVSAKHFANALCKASGLRRVILVSFDKAPPKQRRAYGFRSGFRVQEVCVALYL